MVVATEGTEVANRCRGDTDVQYYRRATLSLKPKYSLKKSQPQCLSAIYVTAKIAELCLSESRLRRVLDTGMW